jgi:dethiobiotin synthetase
MGFVGQTVPGFFVAGTDTGVGKTEVARALLSLLPGAVPLKPVETGCAPDEPEDALALLQASGGSFELDRICPYRFRMPAAPLVAAEAEGKTVSIERIEQLVALASPHPVIVEAAGGLLVPISREVAALTVEQADPAERAPAAALVTNLDLAERLGLPVLLVGRAGLGTLNHCALSAEALARRGLELRAVVLNRVVPEDDPSVKTNRRLVEELTGVAVLGPTPFVADRSRRPAAIAEILAGLVAPHR